MTQQNEKQSLKYNSLENTPERRNRWNEKITKKKQNSTKQILQKICSYALNLNHVNTQLYLNVMSLRQSFNEKKKNKPNEFKRTNVVFIYKGNEKK